MGSDGIDGVRLEAPGRQPPARPDGQPALACLDAGRVERGDAAAAVAAGLGPVAVGTDAAGSVRIPAAFCGLCALKPSRGVMDLPGSPFSLVAAAGPITGTIEDLALALSAFTPPSGITPPLDTVRIGYLTDLGSLGLLDPSVSEMFDRCIRCLADLGLAPAPVSVRPAGLREAITVIWSAALAAVVASVPGGEHQLEPGLLRLAKQGAGYSAGDLLRAQMRAGQFGAELDVLFETGVGLLISPTAATPPFRSGLLVPPGWPGEDNGSTGSRSPTPSTSQVTSAMAMPPAAGPGAVAAVDSADRATRQRPRPAVSGRAVAAGPRRGRGKPAVHALTTIGLGKWQAARRRAGPRRRHSPGRHASAAARRKGLPGRAAIWTGARGRFPRGERGGTAGSPDTREKGMNE